MSQLHKIEYVTNDDGSSTPLQNTLPLTAQGPEKCAVCGRPVREKDGRVRLAERVFHLNCFVCTTCKRSLKEGKLFHDATGKFQCEPCYQSSCAKCARCQVAITDAVFVSKSDTEKYHRECFRCAACERLLVDVYQEHGGKVYCKEDYLAVSAANCFKCKQPICPPTQEEAPSSSSSSDQANSSSATPGPTAGQIVYKSQVYHPDCFLCDGCQGSLDVVQIPVSLTDSDKLLATMTTPTRPNGPAKHSKQFYPMDGQKLCKVCAKVRAKQKKATTPSTRLKSQSSKSSKSSKSSSGSIKSTSSAAKSGSTSGKNNSGSAKSTKSTRSGKSNSSKKSKITKTVKSGGQPASH